MASFAASLQRFLRSPLLVPLALALGLALRLAWVAAVPSYPLVIDFRWYYARAVDIAAGRGFSVGGVPTAFWPVGYPAFLALIFAPSGPSLALAKLANVLLGLGAAALAYDVARRLFRSRMVAALTLLIMACYPNHIAYSSLIASESLFVFLTLLGSALLLRAWGDEPGRFWPRLSLAALAGIVFGLSCLVRVQGLIVPAALLLARLPGLLRRRGALVRQLAFYSALFAACCLTLLPWALRNRAVFGEAVLVSTNGGLVLLAGNGPYATGGETRTPDAYLAELAAGARNEAEVDQRWRRAALEYMATHPVHVLSLLPRKLWYTYNGDFEGIKLNELGLPPPTRWMRASLLGVKGLAQLAYLLVLAGAVGIWLRYGRARRPPSEGVWLVACFTASCLLGVGGTRYHYPLVPWLAMYAAGFAVWLLEEAAPRGGEPVGAASSERA